MRCWRAQPSRDGALGRALATVIGRHQRPGVSRRARRSDPQAHRADGLDRSGGRHRARDRGRFRPRSACAPGETTPDIAARFFTDSSDRVETNGRRCAARWRKAARATSSRATASTNWRQLPEQRASQEYWSIFFTQKGEPRKTVATKAHQGHPALAERLRAEQQRICDLLPRWRAAVTRDRTAALVTIAGTVIESFRAEKDRRGLLDYDDLIEKTGALLTRVEAAWVHYKLDLGIDHVLIDEAQDTSPRQWEVIERLVARVRHRRRRPRAARAHYFRGRRRQAIDLLVPGRVAAGVRAEAPRLPAQL